MLSTASRTRVSSAVLRRGPTVARRYVTDNPQSPNDETAKPAAANVSATNAVPTSSKGAQDRALQESTEAGQLARTMQAPNRKGVWARSQRPREEAMVGPRFEQTIFEEQPRPYAAIDLIHKQPVRWTSKRTVACDGGGGPLGHPRIFINVDKPQICWCTYCGVPYAHEHHRKLLESLPSTTYPLSSTGDAGEVPLSQSPTNKPFEQR